MAPSCPTISNFFFAILALTVVAVAVAESVPSLGPVGGTTPFCFEDCLKQAFSPASSVSWAAGNHNFRGVNSRSILCKDMGRAYFDSVRVNGKLPERYFLALCRVLKDEDRVEAYVKKTFPDNGLEHLLGGQSCKTVTAGKNDPCSVV